MPTTRSLCFVVLIAFVYTSAVSFAQSPREAMELTTGIGKVVKNYPDFPDLNSPAYNVGLNYSRLLDGKKPWHRHYNYPRLGISLNSGSLGNKSVLGYYAGVMPELTFEKQLNHGWYWAPRLSLGCGWFSQPYEETENPENIIIGSALTFFAGAEAVLGKKISGQFDLIAKAGILHASNSHFQLPNVGMNLPVVSLGIRYKLDTRKEAELLASQKDTVKLQTFRKLRLHARVALGINEFGSSTGPVNGPKYPIYLGAVFVSKMFSPVNKVTAGIEAWYNKGVYDYIVSQEFYDEDRQKQACSAAITFGHEFLMGHVGILTTVGIYVYNPFYKDRLEANDINGFKDQLKSHIPARLGVQYYLKNTNFREKNNLFVGVYIKTNFAQADFLESGVGYMF